MDLTFQTERLTDKLWVEMISLIQVHFKEVGTFPDLQISPDFRRYFSLDQNGMLRIVTARGGEVLVGYLWMIIIPPLHYSDILMADNDAIYLRPDFRKGSNARDMIRVMEKELMKHPGIKAVQMRVKAGIIDYGGMLEKMGYRENERIYMKRLNYDRSDHLGLTDFIRQEEDDHDPDQPRP